MKYVAVLLAAAVLLGCNTRNFASKSQTSPSSAVLAAKKTPPEITGGWEIVATSNQTTTTINETRVETQFSESKNGKLAGSPTRVFGLVYPLDLFFLNNLQFGGLCSSVANSSATLTGRVLTKNPHRPAHVGLTLTEAPGVQFDFSGALQSDGSITGTYSGGGTTCADSGSFVAKPAVSMAGSYVNLNSGCITCVFATVSEDTTVRPPAISMGITATTFLGPIPTCTTNFTGTALANSAQVSGIEPDPEACGTGTEETFQGIYFQNPIVLERTIPAALLLFDSSGQVVWFFVP